ncbi:transposase [Atopobium sp. oral taxon 810]|uniref:transposase n=1 Tax=Atopobium sp. oral taxon 810 TaxID=712158 RepID=UPI000A02B547|nr:transposase [Atopobium sp. oral taxon 810]
MVDRNPNKYTEEFRREAADYVISSGKSIAECCKELGLSDKTVGKWVAKRKRQLAARLTQNRRTASCVRPENAYTNSSRRMPS